MAMASVPFIGYDGTIKQVRELSIYAETDQDGEVFYKIKSSNATESAAMEFSYDLEEALSIFYNMATKVLTAQAEELEKESGKI